MAEEYGSAAARNIHKEEEGEQEIPQGIPAAANGGKMEEEGEEQHQPSPPRADGVVNKIESFKMRGMSNGLPQ
jgi:hypothetical protein